jgi:hypothetical protein
MRMSLRRELLGGTGSPCFFRLKFIFDEIIEVAVG